MRQRGHGDRHVRSDTQRARFASDLDPAIRQIHSASTSVPSSSHPARCWWSGHPTPGATSRSSSRRPVRRSSSVGTGPDPGQWDSKGIRVGMPIMTFVFEHVLTRRNPIVGSKLGEVRSHRGPMLRVKRHHLAERGVERIEMRVTGVAEGRPQLADGRVLDVANVVWCTGFRQDFDWIDVPVFGEDGWPTNTVVSSSRSPGCTSAGCRSNTRSARCAPQASVATPHTSLSGSPKPIGRCRGRSGRGDEYAVLPDAVRTVVIGAGQSGLAAGHHLMQRGVEVVILDANDGVGAGWRNRWDSLRLFTPSQYSSLPGMPFPAPRGRSPTRTTWRTTSRSTHRRLSSRSIPESSSTASKRR